MKATYFIVILCCALPSGSLANQQIVPPSNARVETLVRSTLIALDHANHTGNYTVFRDLSSPNFQRANNAAALAAAFTDLRKRNLNLSEIVANDLEYLEPVSIDNAGMLKVSGRFIHDTAAIEFNALYEIVAGRWRLFGISVQP